MPRLPDPQVPRGTIHRRILAGLSPVPVLLGLLSPLSGQVALPATQKDFFGLDRIWDVRLTVAAETWRGLHPGGRQPEPNKRTAFRYARAQVAIAGHPAQEVGVRFKGNSTYWLVRHTLKCSLKVDFDRFEPGQEFLGLKKLNFNNNATDGTQIREAVSYQAYRDSGVPASRTAFARVYLSIPDELENEFLGLYTIVEQVDQGFLRRNLGRKGALLKPTWQVLEHYGDVWNDEYERAYGAKSRVDAARMQPVVDLAALAAEFRDGWSEEAVLTEEDEQRLMSGFADRLERVMDVDAFLRYTAVTTLISNQDSPFTFPHNYYLLVPDETAKVMWLPWDLNNSLGGLGFFGGSNIERRSIVEPTTRPIFARVLGVPRFRARYLQIVAELVRGPCSSARMKTYIETAYSIAKPEILSEKKRSKVVKRAGALGAPDKRGQGSGVRFGLGRVRDLIRLMEKREKSVLDQLAGRSEGIAARKSVLDSVLGGGRRRDRR